MARHLIIYGAIEEKMLIVFNTLITSTDKTSGFKVVPKIMFIQGAKFNTVLSTSCHISRTSNADLLLGRILATSLPLNCPGVFDPFLPHSIQQAHCRNIYEKSERFFV